MATVGRSTRVRTLLLEKTKFTRDEALKWARKHRFKSDEIESGKRFWRIRQLRADQCPQMVNRIIQFRKGIKAVVCR